MPATIVDAVKRNTKSGCHATSCSDRGCSLDMVGAPLPNVLIDLESEDSPTDESLPHCDYLFVGGKDEDGGPWLAPVELGNKKPSVLLPQLQGGADIAEKLTPPPCEQSSDPSTRVTVGFIASISIRSARAAARSNLEP